MGKRKREKAQLAARPQAMAGEVVTFAGLTDPALLDFMRGGSGAMTEAGLSISPRMAMRNTTVNRCVRLISGSIGMLPFHLQDKETKEKASEHPLFRVLHRKPNTWQTAFEFRSLLQQRALLHGDAFALIVRTGQRVTQLIPLANDRVTVEQMDDWSLRYTVSRKNGGQMIYLQRDIFHLRDQISEDGFTGASLVKQAAEAIALAIQTEKAASRLFRNGLILGQTFLHPGKLTPEAFARLKASLDDASGADNAHRPKILEEGMTLGAAGTTGKDAEALEQRRHQIEEIARPFGVPRPLLGVDDTSWGSGIDVLGQMFVQYGLNPWFEAWQQAVERDLLTDAEAELYQAKFNPGGLLRGSMTAQAEFWAKALGAGGQQPFAQPEEARAAFDWPVVDRSKLAPQMGQQQAGGENVAP